MSQTLHIIRKDVRRLRWVLALWVGVLAGYVAVSVSSSTPAVDTFQAQLLFREMLGAFALAQMLLAGLIVSRLVHEEPLVGFNAFWLTRPYDTRVLTAAKLLFVGVGLIAVPLVGDLVTMVLFDARGAALLRGGSASAIASLIATLPLLVIAVLTPSFGAFVLTIVAIIAGLAMAFSVLAAVSMFFADDGPRYFPPAVPDATPLIMMSATFVAASLAVVVYQYLRRRRIVGIGMTVAGLVATVTVPAVWPWSFARGDAIEPGAWAARASAVHDPSWGIEAVGLQRVRGGAPRRQINAKVTLSGVPSDVSVQRVGIRSTLRFDDGTVLESSQMGGYSIGPRTAVLQSAMGGARMLLSVDEIYPRELWTPALHLSEPEFIRYRGRPGRLDMTVDFIVRRTREAGALPLTAGAALDRGVSRVEILAVSPGTDSTVLTVRAWRARAPFGIASGVEREYALRHRARHEALPAGIENTAPVGGRANALIPFARLGGGAISMTGEGGGFSAQTVVLRFPGRGYGEPPPLDPSWYEEAELVILETEPAGVVTKQLTIEDFTIPER